MGIGTAIKSLWNSETIENPKEIIMVNPLLVQAWANIEKSKLTVEVKKGANSAKGGFTKKIDPKTEEAMRAMHKKVVNKGQKTADREIGE